MIIFQNAIWIENNPEIPIIKKNSANNIFLHFYFLYCDFEFNLCYTVIVGTSLDDIPPKPGSIFCLGLNEVSWWHGLLHTGQNFLSNTIHWQIWFLTYPWAAMFHSPVPLQNTHGFDMNIPAPLHKSQKSPSNFSNFSTELPSLCSANFQTCLIQTPTCFSNRDYLQKWCFSFFPRFSSYPFKFFIKWIVQIFEFSAFLNYGSFSLYAYCLVVSRFVTIYDYRYFWV